MSAHLSAWKDHANAGGGFDHKQHRKDYQWNDAGCSAREQAICGRPSRTGSRTLLAYYSFDTGTAADMSGNHRDGSIEGNGVKFVDQGVSGKAAHFDGKSRIVVSAFRSFAWGRHFSVSVWFQRDPSALNNYQGIVNNGYYKHGSWEIRMGREMSGTAVGGGVCTIGHDKTWDVSHLSARVNVWNHVALVYDGETVEFYLNGERSSDENDHGDIKAAANDVVIGQAGEGTTREYFTGLIDEVKIFSRSLSHDEVLDIFRTTPHNGGHCENGAKHTHCNKDGSDYCDAASAHQIGNLGAAHVTQHKRGETQKYRSTRNGM